VSTVQKDVLFNFGELDGELNAKVSLELDDELEGLVDLVNALEQARAQGMTKGFHRWFDPRGEFPITRLPKHASFFEAGAHYRERYFSASNRTGKSISGAYETVLHATGQYPDWWKGKRFDRPINAWAVGTTHETTRNIVQKEIMGEVGQFGTGMIPADLIVDTKAGNKIPGGLDFVKVRHISGGVSEIMFKSYQQGRVGFEGTNQHVIWLDEMPPIDIYSECLIRTAMTKGVVLVTATPVAGLTPFVRSFFNRGDFLPLGAELPGIVKMTRDEEEGAVREKMAKGEMDILDLKRIREEKGKPTTKAVLVCGWDDAPWLDENTKSELADGMQPHERQARMTGLPSMGSGSVFSVPVEEILVQDFDIPKHWKRIGGFDVGWNNTAAMWLAENPDTGEMFFYSEHKQGKQEPALHAQALKMRGDWIPMAIDPASRGASQADGKQLFNTYRSLGVKVFAADNSREFALYEMQQAFASGQLKVFKSLKQFIAEYVTYRRAENGKIIKENDHLLDAGRYAFIERRHAKPFPITRQGGQFLNATGKRYDI
jgi:phage terminase large subunit-like protein